MGTRCHLSVKDQGVGLREEDRARIFERFERAISANEASGLGLGLYIAREIVQAHGGDITVESRLGEGSTFTVALPPAAGGADVASARAGTGRAGGSRLAGGASAPRSRSKKLPTSEASSGPPLSRGMMWKPAFSEMKRTWGEAVRPRTSTRPHSGSTTWSCSATATSAGQRTRGRALHRHVLQLPQVLQPRRGEGREDGRLGQHRRVGHVRARLLDPGLHPLQQPVVPQALEQPHVGALEAQRRGDERQPVRPLRVVRREPQRQQGAHGQTRDEDPAEVTQGQQRLGRGLYPVAMVHAQQGLGRGAMARELGGPHVQASRRQGLAQRAHVPGAPGEAVQQQAGIFSPPQLERRRLLRVQPLCSHSDSV